MFVVFCPSRFSKISGRDIKKLTSNIVPLVLILIDSIFPFVTKRWRGTFTWDRYVYTRVHNHTNTILAYLYEFQYFCLKQMKKSKCFEWMCSFSMVLLTVAAF